MGHAFHRGDGCGLAEAYPSRPEPVASLGDPRGGREERVQLRSLWTAPSWRFDLPPSTHSCPVARSGRLSCSELPQPSQPLEVIGTSPHPEPPVTFGSEPATRMGRRQGVVPGRPVTLAEPRLGRETTSPKRGRNTGTGMPHCRRTGAGLSPSRQGRLGAGSAQDPQLAERPHTRRDGPSIVAWCSSFGLVGPSRRSRRVPSSGHPEPAGSQHGPNRRELARRVSIRSRTVPQRPLRLVLEATARQ